MKFRIDTIQKRVGFLISTVGTFVIIMNLLGNMYNGSSFGEALLAMNVWLDFLLFIPGYLSMFFENKVMKLLQVLAISLTGVANILTSFNEVYGPSLFFMGWLLARQYGYFDIHKKVKYILLIVFFVVMAQVSAYVNNAHVFILKNGLLEFSIFMILFILAIWKDIFDRDEQLFRENRYLKSNYKTIQAKIDTIEKEKIPYDLKGAKITPAEERVLRVLVKYKASNKEIAERLNISESTVKLHLYNIFNKLGADNRFTVIDLCQYNFQG